MTHKGTVALETERLILRSLTLDDFNAVHSWASNPTNTQYMLWGPNSEEQTKTFLINVKSGKDFAVVLKENGNVIGSCGIYPETGNNTGELGWILHINRWKQGYGTEICGALIKYGFEELSLRRIFAECAVENYGSYRVMERNGMLREALYRKAFLVRTENRWIDAMGYAILAEDYYGRNDSQTLKTTSNIETIKRVTELMFDNLRIAMDTSDWNADICGAPAWRYIYHTLHSADKYFINPTQYDEPSFHTLKLDWPDSPSETVLSRETLFAYHEQVRQKIFNYLDNMTDYQLTERPNGKLSRLGLVFSQFRHMYAHIGILNGITIARTNKYPRVLNESRKRPEGLYDEDVR